MRRAALCHRPWTCHLLHQNIVCTSNAFNSENCVFASWGRGEQPKGGPSTIPDFYWIQRILGNSRERRSIHHVHGHRTRFIRIGTGCQPCPRSIDVNHEIIVFGIDIRLMSEAMNNKQNWITYESESSYTTTNNYNSKENIIRTNNQNASSRKFVWTLAIFVSCFQHFQQNHMYVYDKLTFIRTVQGSYLIG